MQLTARTISLAKRPKTATAYDLKLVFLKLLQATRAYCARIITVGAMCLFFCENPLKKSKGYVIIIYSDFLKKEVFLLKHIVTVNKADLKKSAEKGGCGKCQSSCQSACKTSCTVANQKCASVDR